MYDLQTWTPHYFVLTSNKIYYSEETSHYQTADEEEDEEAKEVDDDDDYDDSCVGDAALNQVRMMQFSVCFLSRSVTTTISTVRSAGSMGSWAEGVMVDKWPRSSCKTTVRAGPKTAPSSSGRVRRLSETTPSRSGQ